MCVRCEFCVAFLGGRREYLRQAGDQEIQVFTKVCVDYQPRCWDSFDCIWTPWFGYVVYLACDPLN